MRRREPDTFVVPNCQWKLQPKSDPTAFVNKSSPRPMFGVHSCYTLSIRWSGGEIEQHLALQFAFAFLAMSMITRDKQNTPKCLWSTKVLCVNPQTRVCQIFTKYSFVFIQEPTVVGRRHSPHDDSRSAAKEKVRDNTKTNCYMLCCIIAREEIKSDPFFFQTRKSSTRQEKRR